MTLDFGQTESKYWRIFWFAKASGASRPRQAVTFCGGKSGYLPGGAMKPGALFVEFRRGGHYI